ncbi:hypothetical protein ACFSCX_12825 [Bacillus salitolerans]|uniref:Helix-turn-helix domain-containing protein n=1 Tax=Bacillus salitolerans TaxID=1437434 RepID=A0ABW4LRQ1_9BACI
MEWAFGILLGTGSLLLVFSFLQNKRMERSEQRRLDTMYLGCMEEIDKLQKQIKTIQLDSEITAQEIGISPKDRLMLRDILDLYKRGYSTDSIAEKMKINKIDVQEILTPFMSPDEERRKISNEH